VLSEHGMKIAPQTYYRWLACPIRTAELEEAYLVNQIVDIYRRNKWCMGCGRCGTPLAAQGCRLAGTRSAG
jgi:putative transposase